MKRTVLVLIGLLSVLGLGVAARSLVSDRSGGHVDAKPGDCVNKVSIDWAPDAEGATTPEAAVENHSGLRATDMSQRQVSGDHVVFEKREDGRVTQTFDVVRRNSSWVVDSVNTLGCQPRQNG